MVLRHFTHPSDHSFRRGTSHGRRAGEEKSHHPIADGEDAKKGEPITQLAAYDYRTAVVADRLGMDILCVSDTGGMILFGHKSTVTVSFDEVMMMSKAIDRGSKFGLRMVDMPYWSFHVSQRAGGGECRPLRARGQRRSNEVRRQ